MAKKYRKLSKFIALVLAFIATDEILMFEYKRAELKNRNMTNVFGRCSLWCLGYRCGRVELEKSFKNKLLDEVF